MRRSNRLEEGHTLTQRTIALLVPVLQDLLYVAATEYATLGGYEGTGQEFNGWLNVRMMNAGIQHFYAQPVDFDVHVTNGTVVITAIFVHERAPDDRVVASKKDIMGIKVSVTGYADEADTVAGTGGHTA